MKSKSKENTPWSMFHNSSEQKIKVYRKMAFPTVCGASPIT